VRRQTSYFERAESDFPAELTEGLARLEADLTTGRHPEHDDTARRARLGDAVLVSWTR
jgi:hypothetical protein